MSRHVRGRIVSAVRPVITETGIVATGRKAMIVAYVKTGSKRCCNDFWHHVTKLGLAAKAVQALGDDTGAAFQTAFELVGTPESLAVLVGRYCIADWHWPLDVHIGRIGAGSGDKPQHRISDRDKERAERVADLCRNDGNADGLPTVDRLAVLFATK